LEFQGFSFSNFPAHPRQTHGNTPIFTQTGVQIGVQNASKKKQPHKSSFIRITSRRLRSSIKRRFYEAA
jgi:hypothetical protein